MKKILFLHGFFATGSCPMAKALKEAFDGQATVMTPDLPLHPEEALKYIRILIEKEKPDLLIGNSCGAFLAQMLSSVTGIPALLGNPHFKMTDFLRERIGENAYKAPRRVWGLFGEQDTLAQFEPTNEARAESQARLGYALQGGGRRSQP